MEICTEVRSEKYIHNPECTLQVLDNCDSAIKMVVGDDQVLQNLKTTLNSYDVDILSGKREQELRIPVLNMRGSPLMPTFPRKAKKLIEQGKAKVISRCPFIIQMLIATGETRQDITLGIDSGYSFIGFSLISDISEIISGEVELRKEVSKKIQERAMYRRNRRSKLWHRKWGIHEKGKDWIPPSLKHKLNAHIQLVKKLKSMFPITKLILEIASFNSQKMQNPEISGIEYQQGTLQGYEIREYLLEKFDRTCIYCGKKNVPLEIEHIVPKSRTNDNRVSNLVVSCHECNIKKGMMTATEFGYPELQKQIQKPLKALPFMNLIRKRLADILKCEITFGYKTKHNRIKLGLKKSHINDAFVIAGGKEQIRVKSYKVVQKRRHNRCLQINRNGFKPSIRRKRYMFQSFDLVELKNKIYRVKGVFNYGKWIRLVDKFGNVINSNIKNVRLIQYGRGLQFMC